MKKTLKDKIKHLWIDKLEFRIISITPKISLLHFIDYHTLIDNDLLEKYIDQIEADKKAFKELKKRVKK